jgi:hypothetical protein
MTATKTSARTSGRARPSSRPSGRKPLQVVQPERLTDLVAQIPARLDDDEATAWMVEQLRAMPDGLGLVFPAIRHYLVLHRRHAVRNLERDVIRQFTPGDGTKASISPVKELTLQQLRDVSDAEVFIPGRGKVRSGEVTLREWRLREEFFAAKERGLAAGRAYMRAVMRTLKAHGCASIDEVLGAA